MKDTYYKGKSGKSSGSASKKYPALAAAVSKKKKTAKKGKTGY